MEKQGLLSKYLKIYKFHSAYGSKEASKRVLATIKELDLFDYKYKVNTRTIKVIPLAKMEYMPYWPVYTSVALEMIRIAHNYYISAVRYSDLKRKTVFVDFGSGACKAPIIAALTRKFDACIGVEIDESLHELAQINLRKIDIGKSAISIHGNAEENDSVKKLVDFCLTNDIQPKAATLFVFNKNSYGPSTLERNLKLLQKHFDSIIYLYQNPIHSSKLTSMGFEQFASDSHDSTVNKNYKFRLFLKHKYNK